MGVTKESCIPGTPGRTCKPLGQLERLLSSSIALAYIALGKDSLVALVMVSSSLSLLYFLYFQCLLSHPVTLGGKQLHDMLWCYGDRAPQAVQCIKTNVFSPIWLWKHKLKILVSSLLVLFPEGLVLTSKMVCCCFFQHGKQAEGQKRGLANFLQLFHKALIPAVRTKAAWPNHLLKAPS